MKLQRKVCLIVVFVALLSISFAALAEGEDALGALDNMAELAYGVTRVIGLIAMIWGVVQLGISLAQHDPSQRSTAFMSIAGGVLIFFVKEIISAITGS